MKKGEMDNLDLFSMIFAGSIHDFEHPGFTNPYLINSGDALAIRYNDISVLESHHVAASYKLLKEKQYNFLGNVHLESRIDIRKRVVSMVLATDMSKHFADLGKFKSRVQSEGFDPSDSDKMDCMCLGMHMADISNPSKKWSVSLNWVELLFEEFFYQGDDERKRGIKISDLCDRTQINIAKAQVGFIGVIVLPAFEVFEKFLPHISINLDTLKSNKEKWGTLVDDYQEKMEKERDKMGNTGAPILEEDDEDDDDDDSSSQPDQDSVDEGMATPNN